MSELEDRLVAKFKRKIDEEYIRAIVGLKENNTNRRFLQPSIESPEGDPGIIRRVWNAVKNKLI